MSLVIKSLDAATSPTVGAAGFFDVPKAKFSMQVEVTGSPTSISLELDGTIDGVNFFFMGQWSPGQAFLAVINACVVKGVRANLTSLSGGTSPTVTATIAAA